VPNIRHTVIVQTVEDYFKFLTHHDETVDGFVDVDERRMHCFEKFVETHQLLLKYSVHGFLIFDWM
jgi:hypothetical protein